MTRKPSEKKGFLTRLLRSEAGNTLAMTAAATIPLIGMIGGGVDISRLYLVKTRLQQACDAGALAGRKAQAGGTWTTAHQTTANQIFATNFEDGAYGTTGLTRNFTENQGTVTGAVAVTVPMMIMKIFGYDQRAIAVTCDAEMRLPNSDIMFVLDVTGSMNCQPAHSGYTCPNGNNNNVPATGSKIGGLQTAVQCFYEILMKTDTDADCGSTPSGGISNDIQVRFGFVPYSVNVNVGKLLPNSYLADSWPYQTRVGVYYRVASPTPVGSWDESTSGLNNKQCNSWAIGDDTTGFPSSSTTPPSFTVSTTTYTFVSYTASTKKTPSVCTRRVNQSTVEYTHDDVNGTYFHTWIYQQESLNISGLKAGGSSWNSSVSLKVGDDGAFENVSWGGCIEERKTVRDTDFDPIPSGANDLNIDMVPTSDITTQWGAILPNAVFQRTWSYDPVTTSGNYNNATAYCPTTSRRLARYTTTTERDDFVSYVNGLQAIGNTYHDIGLIWGARLMSPTGIFADDNDFTPQGGEIERHLIFMTDGDTMTSNTNYTAYGVPWWDRRTTTDASAPSSTDLNNNVNARFEGLCTAIKNMNITLWVVNYGGDVTTTTGQRLEDCASDGRYYEATSTTDLLTAFQEIAAQISQLRLTN